MSCNVFLSKTIHHFKLLDYNECVKNDFMAELLKPGAINMSVYNYTITMSLQLNLF